MPVEMVRSDDGTKIAYEREGNGPLLIIVDGALTTRWSGSKRELVDLLAPHYTVIVYDRRGRGDSGDTAPYSVQREIDDIEEIIDSHGGSAFLYGHSSGGCLALEAAALLGYPEVMGVAVYEAPYDDDPSIQPGWTAYLEALGAALGGGRRGDAVALFLEYLGIPAAHIAGVRQSPAWPGMEALAHTLAYDHAGVMGESRALPRRQLAFVNASTLAMAGGASPPAMAATARAISEAVTTAEVAHLDGQGHDVAPSALAPLLVEFFERG